MAAASALWALAAAQKEITPSRIGQSHGYQVQRNKSRDFFPSLLS